MHPNPRPDQPTVDAAFAAIVTDMIGTPIRLLDHTGTTTWTNTPTLWGRASSNTDAVMPLRFPGQYLDAETGLHYNLFRYYDPDTGRYLTQDPLGLQPSPNPGTYPNNPTASIDPEGLIRCRPEVTNQRLKNIVDHLFRGTEDEQPVGDGTTMDAIRNELRTGEPTKGKMHIRKGHEQVRALRKWLRQNPNASESDRKVALDLYNELLEALDGH